jgi:WD40 repeat protein/serine/threonine protein kinase
MNENLVGQTLGKYRTVARLGEGGMAEVYKAYQPGLDRYVAIKIMKSHIAAQKGSARRFEREAVAVARLRHPNIVQVYDFDAQGEQRYMVMEFIDGPTLRSELDARRDSQQPFVLAEIAPIFTALTSATEYAHSQGIIHHDLKPDNAMITAAGQIVLTDFGIAQMVDVSQQSADQPKVVGTPAYMAPEQGNGVMDDKRSDIYSLGIILYELATGQVPFSGENPISVIVQHIKDKPPLPSTINAQIPQPIEEIILKALKKEPAERFQSAAELGQALWQAAGAVSQQAQPPTGFINVVAAAPHLQEISLTPDYAPLSPSDPIPPCPYRGLFPFQAVDAPFFFGRESFTARLLEAVHNQPLVAVLGPSGSGKSSVVQAGLIPRLQREATTEMDMLNWHITTMRPGSHPFRALAAALLPQLQPGLSDAERLVETNKLVNDLRHSKLGLPQLVAQLLRHQPANQTNNRVLLVIDQFEELYTLCTSQQTRHHFLDELLAGVESARGNNPGLTATAKLPLSIVLTMRADFLAQALTHREFADALQLADVKLGPMTRQELERAIENPAARQGVLFEKGLAARILDDVGEDAGRLPLLEFALTLLWERQVGGLLTHEAYEASGRVEGALAHYADDVYAMLSPGEQQQARSLFVQLVRPGEGTEDTRRITTRTELGESNWALAQRMATSRLVVTSRGAAGDETAEVVHEALIRGWEQLRRWMKADRTFRAWQERLRQALQQWESSNRDESALLRGVLLAEAESWFTERQADLSEIEQTFIQASMDLRRQKEEAQERQRRAVLIRMGAGLVVTTLGLLLVLVLAVVALFTGRQAIRAADEASQARATAEAEAELAETQRQIAEEQRQIAEEQQQEADAQRAVAEEQQRAAQARQLVAQTQNLAATQPDLALLLSLEAARTDPGLRLETQRSLLTALETNPRLKTFLRGHLGEVEDAVFSPDGKILASAGGADDIIILWDVEKQAPLGPPLTGHSGAVFDLAFSPGGELLASASEDQSIILWDVATGIPAGPPLTGHTGQVEAVAFNRDGTLLASGGSDAQIILWDVANRSQQGQLAEHESNVTSVAFSPTSNILASGSRDSTVILWDVASRQPLATPLTGHTDWVNSVTFSPTGRTLASGGRDGNIILWDLTSQPYQRYGRPLSDHTNTVLSLDFSPNGQTLVSGSYDKTIILWDVATLRPLGPPLTGHADRVVVDFSPDGQTLASASGDGSIGLWDLSVRQRLATPLAEQPAAVLSVALSPDERQLASAGIDGSIILWNLATGTAVGPPLKSHTDRVWEVAFSPDGQLLASASGDKSVILWDVETRQPLGSPLTGHTDWVRSVAFSPDGRTLASAGDDQTIRLWDVDSRRPIGSPLAGHIDWIRRVEFSPDGQTLASASEDGTIILWDVASGEPLGSPLIDHTDWVMDLAFSPDGQRLASASRDSTIILWDVSNRESPVALGEPITGHTDTVLAVAFSPDGQRLASGSWDETVRLWDVATGEAVASPFTGHTGPVWSVAFNSDGRTLVSGSEDGTVLRWDVERGQPVGEPLSGHRRPVRSVAFSADGETMAWGSEDESITLWDVTGNERLAPPLTGHTDWVNGLAFSAATGLLASGDGDGSIMLWDGETGDLVDEIAGHTDWIGDVAMNPEGTLLATGGGDQVVHLWDISAGSIQPLDQLSSHTGDVESVAFSPDGQLLASASADQTIILWNVDTGRQQAELVGHTDTVHGVAFSPDGKVLASGSTDNTVRLWDVETGEPLDSPLVGHSSWVGTVAFNPEGTILATGGGDNRIILWDVAARQPLGPPLAAHTAEIEAVAFSPDGRSLVSVGQDGVILRWDVSADSWQERACQIAARNLSWEQWQQYIGSEPYRSTCPNTPLYLAHIYIQADVLAQAGQMEAAAEMFEQAVLVAGQTGSAVLNNNICWFGSLDNLAETVLPACDYAVGLAPDNVIGLYRDSRGLARALTGDFEGASEDFEAFVSWSRSYGQYNEARIKRHAWITTLQEGQNPFDEATLTDLRSE